MYSAKAFGYSNGLVLVQFCRVPVYPWVKYYLQKTIVAEHTDVFSHSHCQNAIRIQIWCALIADMLLNILRRFVKKKWAFSNIASLIRLHLFNYLDLIGFLENPEACKINQQRSKNQLEINLSG
jgi:hypothetical protein